LLVSRQLKGKTALEAITFLQFLGKGSALPLKKLVESAVADAENNFNLKAESLVVLKIEVLKGGMYKRQRPRSRGMSHPILKKNSHIKLYLTDGKEVKEEKKTEKSKDKTETKAPKKVVKKATTKTKKGAGSGKKN